MSILELALANLTSPMVLCFVLGIGAGLAKSDLDVPDAIAKGLALFLMLSIGLQGGWKLAEAGASLAIALDLGLAVAVSFLMPLPAYFYLRVAGRLDRENAAAIAAHYGSISVVTFAIGTQFIGQRNLPFEGHIVAMVALMETPAIITGLLLARSARNAARDEEADRDHLLREVLFNGSVLLLVGGFIIGWIGGASGKAAVAPFFLDPFRGALCLFLLDMGLVVARRSRGFAALRPPLIVYGIGMPMLGGALGAGLGTAIGLSLGGATLFAVLCASASYIAVPAAMRLALPRADPSLYVGLSLGITFPFNVVLGIPAYFALAEALR